MGPHCNLAQNKPDNLDLPDFADTLFLQASLAPRQAATPNASNASQRLPTPPNASNGQTAVSLCGCGRRSRSSPSGSAANHCSDRSRPTWRHAGPVSFVTARAARTSAPGLGARPRRPPRPPALRNRACCPDVHAALKSPVSPRGDRASHHYPAARVRQPACRRPRLPRRKTSTGSRRRFSGTKITHTEALTNDHGRAEPEAPRRNSLGISGFPGRAELFAVRAVLVFCWFAARRDCADLRCCHHSSPTRARNRPAAPARPGVFYWPGMPIEPLRDAPHACQYGHPWGPGQVIVSWLPCSCPPARAERERGSGHFTMTCQAPGCQSVWYQPRHEAAPG